MSYHAANSRLVKKNRITRRKRSRSYKTSNLVKIPEQKQLNLAKSIEISLIASLYKD